MTAAWLTLWGATGFARRQSRSTPMGWDSLLTAELVRLHAAGHCNAGARFWVSTKVEGRYKLTSLHRGGDAMIGNHRAIALTNLPKLTDGKLSFSVTEAVNSGELVKYTVTVVGNEPSTSKSWYVRVDLDPNPGGHGPCSHPMLHGHVGSDPNAGGEQDIRTPLAWLEPHQALQFVLATVAPSVEPRLPRAVLLQRLRVAVAPWKGKERAAADVRLGEAESASSLADFHTALDALRTLLEQQGDAVTAELIAGVRNVIG